MTFLFIYLVAPSKRLERSTHCLEGSCSIHLSYEGSEIYCILVYLNFNKIDVYLYTIIVSYGTSIVNLDNSLYGLIVSKYKL